MCFAIWNSNIQKWLSLTHTHTHTHKHTPFLSFTHTLFLSLFSFFLSPSLSLTLSLSFFHSGVSCIGRMAHMRADWLSKPAFHHTLLSLVHKLTHDHISLTFLSPFSSAFRVFRIVVAMASTM